MPRVAVVLFDNFASLDVFGPLQILTHRLAKPEFSILNVSRDGKPVLCSTTQHVTVHCSFAAVLEGKEKVDTLFVPGGMGTRSLCDDTEFLDSLKAMSEKVQEVWSVCTGSALLAKAGLLDGIKATANKASYVWNTSQGPKVQWVHKARWVHDKKGGKEYWTSSGVAAGMDMAHAIATARLGAATAKTIVDQIEYEPHTDSSWDPFSETFKLAEQPSPGKRAREPSPAKSPTKGENGKPAQRPRET